MSEADFRASKADTNGSKHQFIEGTGIFILLVSIVYFLSISWRKWPEPLIDFGRELYVPWRLANGAMLYRDVDDFYGPLSQYINAGLFRLFGPGLMVLVGANLAVFGAIVASIYSLFRKAWGPLAAFTSSILFISVFGFSAFVGGNHNYATPYSHEATHGVLVCLLLVLTLNRWIAAPSVSGSALAGILLGVSAVLKPEIMLAAFGLTLTAILLGGQGAKQRRLASLVAWLSGAILPTILFCAYFSTRASPEDALRMATRAWLSVLSTNDYTSDVIQTSFLGFDHVWTNLSTSIIATLLVLLGVGILAGISFGIDRLKLNAARIVIFAAAVLAVAWFSWASVKWIDAGHTLLGLSLSYLASLLLSRWRGSPQRATECESLRFLIVVLSLFMMSRMLLNGRIYQFGFYQAAIAAIVIPAVILAELPRRLGLKTRGRNCLVALSLVSLCVGTIRLALQSETVLRHKTYAVGTGIDQFYSLPPQWEPTGKLVNTVAESLREMPIKGSLLVLPEGEMINYLTRMPNTVSPFFYFSAATRNGREQSIVTELGKNPPDWVVIISRDLREYGITRYGETSGQGKEILQWCSAHYRLAEHIGGDPLDIHERGAVILRIRR